MTYKYNDEIREIELFELKLKIETEIEIEIFSNFYIFTFYSFR